MLTRTALLLLIVASPAVADGLSDLRRALGVEWMVAHCVILQEQSAVVIMASMMINGSDPALVAKERSSIQQQFKDRYRDDAEACAAFGPALKSRS